MSNSPKKQQQRKDGSPHKLTYNEKTVANAKGDYLSLEVTGNRTENNNVFREDLGNNEKITCEFNVDLKPPIYRSLFLYYLLCICTFGLYFVYINYCYACRSKVINTRRAKLALTSKGRLGLWVADTQGSQNGDHCLGCRGSRTFKSTSKVSWFHINDLSHIQHYHFVRNWTSCLIFRRFHWESSLRLFFGVFPDQALIDAYNLRLAIPKTISMDIGLKPDEIAAYYNVSAYFKRLSSGVTHAVRQTLSIIGAKIFDDSIMIEISTSKDDNLHVDQNLGRFELFEIQQALLSMKKTNPISGISVNPSAFRLMQQMTPLVENNVAQLDMTSIAMMPQEQILDAHTFANSWTLKEMIFTMSTFGIYWFFVARFRHGLRSALVLTNFRLLEVSQDYPDQCCMSGDNLTYIVRGWFLTGLDTGVVCREKHSIWSILQLRYGCIRIRPFVKTSSWFGISAPVVERTMRFLKLFALAEQPKVFNGRQQQILPELMQSAFPLGKDEQYIGYLASEGIQYNGLQILGSQPPEVLATLFSCGKFPYRIQQELGFTSRRILARAYATNDPVCCEPCRTTQYQFLFWSALSSRYFIGLQNKGTVMVRENIFLRILNFFGLKTARTQAFSELALSYAFTSERKGFPISVLAKQANTKSGLLDNPNLIQMRVILGHLHAAKADRGPDPYFAAAPAAKSEVPQAVQQYYAVPLMQYVAIELPTAPSYDPRHAAALYPSPVLASAKVEPMPFDPRIERR